jgi:hypothetical protein
MKNLYKIATITTNQYIHQLTHHLQMSTPNAHLKLNNIQEAKEAIRTLLNRRKVLKNGNKRNKQKILVF